MKIMKNLQQFSRCDMSSFKSPGFDDYFGGYTAKFQFGNEYNLSQLTNHFFRYFPMSVRHCFIFVAAFCHHILLPLVLRISHALKSTHTSTQSKLGLLERTREQHLCVCCCYSMLVDVICRNRMKVNTWNQQTCLCMYINSFKISLISYTISTYYIYLSLCRY